MTSLLAGAADSPFPMENLPLGVGGMAGTAPTVHVAIGDSALDLAGLDRLGLLDGVGAPAGAFTSPALNRLLAAGRAVGTALRTRLTELLTDEAMASRLKQAAVARRDLAMRLPVIVGDYVDFYSSIHHATNLGRLFRPDGEPLLPNWRHLPVAYHGRAASLVVSGTDVVRPHGLRMIDDEPRFGPTGELDIELEVGFVVGVGNERGRPIDTADAGRHLAGVCLVNDWSARDIQSYEYVPLGPFLGKSFATSVSPWLVSLDALEPYRVEPPVQAPEPVRYLQCTQPWGLDLHLEILLDTAAMRRAGLAPVTLSRTGFADMYWTPAQQLAHITVNGAATRPGDLLASGTVSGPDPHTEGSLIEMTHRGACPIELPTGEQRAFLLDGDRITIRGWAGGTGRPVIGLGEVTGTVVESSPRS